MFFIHVRQRSHVHVEAAREAERTGSERLALALEAGRMGVWEWDLASDTIYRLTGIVRAEPARSLFDLPPDYTLHESAIRRQQ